MLVPDDLLYSADHEWVQRSGDRIRIGITDYAQDALGDVVYVQTPTIGTVVAEGASFSEIESTKSVSDIFAPVAGTVVAVNELLSDAPEVVNRDPYGDGWLCELLLADAAQLASLMDASAYRLLTES